MSETSAGILIVAAAPLGRADDASPRLAAALAGASVVAAEDTRRLRRLAAELGVRVTGSVVSYYEAVEQRREDRLLADLRAGRDVLLVTDAGMPGVSDPGYRIVKAAAAAGIRVTVLPGPSAVTAALAVAGLPTDRFCFEGFPPRRAGDRARRFAELAGERRTMVFFESRRHLARTLGEMTGAFGRARPAVVCREMTKTHEEVRRGTLGDLAEWAANGVLGEVTIVVAGAARVSRGASVASGDPARGDRARGDLASGDTVSGHAAPGGGAACDPAGEVARRQAGGMPKREAIAAVAAGLRIPKRVVYDAVIARNRADGTEHRQS